MLEPSCRHPEVGVGGWFNFLCAVSGADASTGVYPKLPGESTRQYQFRIWGVWRARGGWRQAEFKPKHRNY